MPHEFKLEPDEYFPINDYIFGALERYLNHGIDAGGFMMSVLENNLCEAFARADMQNARNMKNIVSYVYNHMPSNAWGSKEKVAAYIQSLKQPTEKESL